MITIDPVSRILDPVSRIRCRGEAFAYHIELSWWIFLGAGLIALVIAVLTVSYQAIKAALADPVEALRYE